MQSNSEIVCLLWEGASSVDAARHAMQKGKRVEIALPQGVHHALFRHLNPQAPLGAPEAFDAEGGPELLPRIATVAGLRELEQLERLSRRARYRVELSSPDPLLVLTPSAPSAAGVATRRAAG